jgi:hypothetical protein
MLFQKKILAYKPDRVYVAINASDIFYEVIVRGGWERFQPDGTVQASKGPRWQWLYSKSFLFRLFIHQGMRLNWVFLSNDEVATESKKAIAKIEDCLTAFEQLCRQNHIRCIFIFHPREDELLSNSLSTVDLLNYAKSKNYEAVNMLDVFKTYGIDSTNVHTYFWKNDGHYTNAGYRVFAQGLLPLQ